MRYKTYILYDGKGVKIGKVLSHSNFINRIRTLQIGNPNKIIPLGGFNRDIETELHREFKAYKIRGEWFDPFILSFLLGKEGFLDIMRFKEHLYLKHRLSFFS